MSTSSAPQRSNSTRKPTLVRVVMAGDQATGKTSLLVNYTQGDFKYDVRSTVGVDYQHIEIEPNIRLDLWDTAGQERFRSIVSQYFRKAHAVVLVYDITNQDSFDSVSSWMESIYQTNSSANVILVGNKIDRSDCRVVTPEQGKELARQFQIHFIECSAKTGENVKTAFEKVGRDAAEVRAAQYPEFSGHSARNVHIREAPSESKGKGCCRS